MKNRFASLIIALGLIVLTACNAPPADRTQSEFPTPVYIPVIVTVGIPVPVTITPTEEPPPEQPVLSSNISVVQTLNLKNLEEDSQKWKVYEEGSPTWTLQNADTPSQNGKSLQCGIIGGSPYSNVHCYINIDPEIGANSFNLNLAFQFSPITTCNNLVTPSVVQAVEFTMNKWENSKRYEFAVQWQNVGDVAPQWRYWDATKGNTERWVPINAKATYCLDGDLWHTLVLDGDIIDDQVHYKSFTIDNFTYNLDIAVAPAPAPNEDNRLAIAVQVDGNEQESPYDLFIDNVDFTVLKNIDCKSIRPNEAEFNFPYIEHRSPITQFQLLPTTQFDDVLIVNKNTKVTWKPACLMDIQYYQNGIVVFDEKDASSDQYDFAEETLTGGEIPVGVDTQIKIWGGGEVIKDIWVRIKE